MKINKIKINSYGKIKNKEIKLNNNLNIIYGKNESGKSTILNFIFNILYGIQKNKNGKEISDYEKYKPWDSDEFSGKITYELDNKNKYEIYREFIEEKRINYKERKTSADILVSHFCYVYDLNFHETREIIKENEYIDKLYLRFIFNDTETTKRF